MSLRTSCTIGSVCVLGIVAACSSNSRSLEGSTAAETCPPSPAPGIFTNALCLCDDYNDVGSGLITSAPNGGAANVGVNGSSHVVGQTQIGGSWMTFHGLDGVGQVSVRDNLTTTGGVDGVGTLTVGKDLSVGGNLNNVGTLAVDGTLRLAGTESMVGQRTVNATGPYAAPAGPPCACDPKTFLDVAARVAAAKQHNDNGKLSFSSLDHVGSQTLTFPTGSYYFAKAETVGQNAMDIEGTVAIFIDGNVDSVGEDNIHLAPGATLDLYISGALQTVGQITSGPSGSAFRLFVGGSNPVIATVGQQHLHGALYAPNASFNFVGEMVVQGAVFAKELNGVGSLRIEYLAPESGTCNPPDAGKPPPDAGTAPDAGPTCAGLSAACSATMDCCAGLACLNAQATGNCNSATGCACHTQLQ